MAVATVMVVPSLSAKVLRFGEKHGERKHRHVTLRYFIAKSQSYKSSEVNGE